MCVRWKNGTIFKEEFEKWEDTDSSPDITEYPTLCVRLSVEFKSWKMSGTVWGRDWWADTE